LTSFYSCRPIRTSPVLLNTQANLILDPFLPTSSFPLSHTHSPIQLSTNTISPTLQSQAIRANGTIFVSGQIPADSTGTLVTGTIGEQTQACCNNIQAILTAAGSEVSKIVKVNVFLTDMANFAEMNATYEKFFVHKPARSCVAVHQLPKGVPVEIECIALE
jgi:reactive intermediate/imine deaminase